MPRPGDVTGNHGLKGVQMTGIGVGAITRRRHDMLSDLLDSYSTMRVPDGCEVVFIFVENDTELTIRTMVDLFSRRTGHPAEVALEPRQGIPIARNRVLDIAVAAECDHLTFVDDDETVDPDWLTVLHAVAWQRDLDLVGGPVRYKAPDAVELTWRQRAVLQQVKCQAKRAGERRKTRVEAGRDETIPVYTNNWMLRLAAQKDTGVRFDERLRFTGGSDKKFFEDIKAANGSTGWAPDAMVSEVWPVSRLTFRYYYSRCRDQAATAMARKKKRFLKLEVTVFLLWGMLRACVLAMVGIFDRGVSFARACRVAGTTVGRTRAVFGYSSSHYDPGRSCVHETHE